MRCVVALLVVCGCTEYGFGSKNRDNVTTDPLAGLGDGDGDGNGAIGDEDREGNDPLEPFPGENLPPEWTEWDQSCRNAGFGGGGGGPSIDNYTIDEPIHSLHVLLTVGDLTIVPRDGPVEVELRGVTLNGAQGPSVVGGVLTLDYAHTVGDLTVYAPADLDSYDFRMCVGDLDFEALENHVTAEVRVGNIDGNALLADDAWIHNLTGNADLTFDAAPATLWMDGRTGRFAGNVATDRCNCDLNVTGAGITSLDGISHDPNAPTEVWARRQTGTITVSGR